MSPVYPLHPSTSPEAVVDHLGLLRAQIADLQAQAKAAEALLKAHGEGTIEGSTFRATVAVYPRTSVDWKAVAAKLEPSRQLVTAHTTTTTAVRLTVTARKRSAA